MNTKQNVNEVQPPALAELLNDYRFYDQSPDNGVWVVACRHCRDRWLLGKPLPGSEPHAGNVLKLLDHAASHKTGAAPRSTERSN